eukprot:6212237-Pleurochrysis_carterae.AAC.3
MPFAKPVLLTCRPHRCLCVTAARRRDAAVAPRAPASGGWGHPRASRGAPLPPARGSLIGTCARTGYSLCPFVALATAFSPDSVRLYLPLPKLRTCARSSP